MIFCAPVPLKFTALGMDDVTFKVPAVMVKILAIPNVDPEDNCNDVPLRVVLKRFAVPLKEETPVNVTVPADADKLPLTIKPDEIEKLTSVVTEPATDNTLKLLVPAPEMVFELPLIVILPALDVKLPLTERLPVRLKEVEELTDPLMVRLSNTIPEPLMVLLVPVINIVPPEA